MITEMTHDTGMLSYYNLKAVRLIHVITCSDNNIKFLQGLKIAAHKYHNFVHKYHYGMLQQRFYLNTQCAHYNYNDVCKIKDHRSCCMNSGIYCKDYCKEGEYK